MDLPKVNFDFTKVDGNAFSLLGYFARQAKRDGWTSEQIEEVKKEAMHGDYDHLVATLVQYCEVPEPEITYE